MMGTAPRGARSDNAETVRLRLGRDTFARVGEEEKIAVDEVGTGVG